MASALASFPPPLATCLIQGEPRSTGNSHRTLGRGVGLATVGQGGGEAAGL